MARSKLMNSEQRRTATFFATPNRFRAWLKSHHASKSELWVGFYKRDSNRPSITWPQSVDEALCFGWIDGLRQSIDESSYRIRFTPRKATSNWSAININRVVVLTTEGRMHTAGQKAFAKRKVARSRIYTYENPEVEFAPEYARRLRKNKSASAYFDAQTPSYRKLVRGWIMNAKQSATRETRLTTLIECSARGEIVPPYRWGTRARQLAAKNSVRKK
jgi:uncharacterized protein YdeI (YjbR/CyaY-like superfamily)